MVSYIKVINSKILTMSISSITIRSLILVALLFGSTNNYAVNAPPPVSVENAELAGKKSKKVGVVKKWVIKRLAKKIAKQIKETDQQDLSITKKARLGLIFGIVSILLLFVGLAALWLWLVAGVAAILGDIFSIIVLVKTKENKKLFKKERRMATWGLVLSLLTGIIPLSLLLLVVLSL